MPASRFICPDGNQIEISNCLQSCRLQQRCMLLPTLRAIAQSVNRNIQGFTVTELIGGVREMYLKKTFEYAVDPMKRVYALHGTAAHRINEGHTEGEIFSEERLNGEACSGQFDMFGSLLDDSDATLGDIKVTSSYKLMRALGMYKVDVPTGDIYKSGSRKGQAKTVKEWRTGGVRHLFDWAVQVNYYRILLEAQGFEVNRMVIQALCRDSGLRIASERNINQPVYLIDIHRISAPWIKRYLEEKAKMLQRALDSNVMPELCTPREAWHGRKCAGYCEVAGFCDRQQESWKDEAA